WRRHFLSKCCFDIGGGRAAMKVQICAGVASPKRKPCYHRYTVSRQSTVMGEHQQKCQYSPSRENNGFPLITMLFPKISLLLFKAWWSYFNCFRDVENLF
ncbi:MAG: hypothetical protein RR413_11710, partial [Christensenellaceae bacterium]